VSDSKISEGKMSMSPVAAGAAAEGQAGQAEGGGEVAAPVARCLGEILLESIGRLLFLPVRKEEEE
jgi:hypothetical protein